MPGDRHSRADSPTPAGDRPTLSPARPGDIVESANGEGVVAQAAGPRPPARSQALHNAVQRWGPVIWLVLLGGLIGTFMVHEREHIAQLGTVLGGARLPWVLAAGVLEVLYLVLIGKTYQAVLTRLGQDIELWPVLEAYLRSHAVGSVVPFSGPTTAVLFIRYLTRARVPGASRCWPPASPAWWGMPRLSSCCPRPCWHSGWSGSWHNGWSPRRC